LEVISEAAIIEIVKTVVPIVCGCGVFVALVGITVGALTRRRKMPKEGMEAIIDLNDRLRYLERRLENHEDEVKALRDETQLLKDR
jgi:hypothetical protein